MERVIQGEFGAHFKFPEHPEPVGPLTSFTLYMYIPAFHFNYNFV